MKTKLIVCHARPGDAYEIQTDETPRRLVAALFHNGNDPGRLLMEEAAVYASIFAAAPKLLQACKQLLFLWWNTLQKCSESDCLVCKENALKKKEFEDIIAKAERPE